MMKFCLAGLEEEVGRPGNAHPIALILASRVKIGFERSTFSRKVVG